jgi:hypothetical protein
MPTQGAKFTDVRTLAVGHDERRRWKALIWMSVRGVVHLRYSFKNLTSKDGKSVSTFAVGNLFVVLKQ